MELICKKIVLVSFELSGGFFEYNFKGFAFILPNSELSGTEIVT